MWAFWLYRRTPCPSGQDLRTLFYWILLVPIFIPLVMVDHKEPMSILMDQPVMLLLVLTLWLGLEGMLLA
nr:hypothetical protein Q903MT_gene1170 [Picea sitchensis]